MSADGKDGYASLRAARELKNLVNARTVFRVLMSYGFTSIVSYDKEGKLTESCSFERMLEEM